MGMVSEPLSVRQGSAAGGSMITSAAAGCNPCWAAVHRRFRNENAQTVYRGRLTVISGPISTTVRSFANSRRPA